MEGTRSRLRAEAEVAAADTLPCLMRIAAEEPAMLKKEQPPAYKRSRPTPSTVFTVLPLAAARAARVQPPV